MLNLNDFRTFVEIADRGGFSAAARALKCPTSTLSHRIKQLERDLGVALLARTARGVVLTQAGEQFYSHAASVMERANEAESVMRSRATEPTGSVHYTVAPAVAQFAMPAMLLSFMAQYPRVVLVQHAANTQADIVAEKLDLAIRAHCHPLPDSHLIQRPLADAPWHLFASPGYVAKTGGVKSPADLKRRETLCMTLDNTDPVWRLRRVDDSSQVSMIQVQPRMFAGCVVTLKQAAEAGTGIVALPAYICRDEVRSGRLQRVLPDWIAADSKISALMPHRRGITAAARAFIDHIAAAFPAAVRLESGDRGNTHHDGPREHGQPAGLGVA
jgi:DNA-binding transcriptional LysR family regulator